MVGPPPRAFGAAQTAELAAAVPKEALPIGDFSPVSFLVPAPWLQPGNRAQGPPLTLPADPSGVSNTCGLGGVVQVADSNRWSSRYRNGPTTRAASQPTP